MFEVLGLNGEDLFKYARKSALKYKRCFSKYVLGLIHLNIIRAREAEVV
jgi:hypothetical protein